MSLVSLFPSHAEFSGIECSLLEPSTSLSLSTFEKNFLINSSDFPDFQNGLHPALWHNTTAHLSFYWKVQFFSSDSFGKDDPLHLLTSCLEYQYYPNPFAGYCPLKYLQKQEPVQVKRLKNNMKKLLQLNSLSTKMVSLPIL